MQEHLFGRSGRPLHGSGEARSSLRTGSVGSVIGPKFTLDRVFSLPKVALLIVVAGSCQPPELIAKVGDSGLFLEDFTSFVEGRRHADEESALGSLIEREVLAQYARNVGLNKDEGVQAKIRAAEREILALALLSKELGSASSVESLRARFRENEELYGRRRIHVRQILVSVASYPNEGAAQAQANTLYARAVIEGGFSVLAAELSEDAASAPKDGDMGPIFDGEVDSTFFEGAWALKKGEISLPVRTPWGFHVLQAIEDPRVEVPSFEDVRGTLESEVRREAQRDLQERARRTIKVEIFRDQLGGGHR